MEEMQQCEWGIKPLWKNTKQLRLDTEQFHKVAGFSVSHLQLVPLCR